MALIPQSLLSECSVACGFVRLASRSRFTLLFAAIPDPTCRFGRLAREARFINYCRYLLSADDISQTDVILFVIVQLFELPIPSTAQTSPEAFPKSKARVSEQADVFSFGRSG